MAVLARGSPLRRLTLMVLLLCLFMEYIVEAAAEEAFVCLSDWRLGIMEHLYCAVWKQSGTPSGDGCRCTSQYEGRCCNVHKPQGTFNCDFELGLCGWRQAYDDNFDWSRRSGSTPSSNTGPNADHTTGISTSGTFNCDFELGLCGWRQAYDDNFDWSRRSGSTPSSNTGPNADHTTGSGYYIYIETSSVSSGSVARVISPLVTATSAKCVQFCYHMYGRNVNRLKVYIKTGSSLGNPVWTRTGAQGNQWNFGQVDIPAGISFNIVFEASRGSGYYGDISLDDISIVDNSSGQQDTGQQDTIIINYTSINLKLGLGLGLPLGILALAILVYVCKKKCG
ncbi:PREDICTED: MAM and LDL-receptor class A domain-containing protein 1-like [Branchiostoma belcheri]|uniref:MAM and LDL-receptor class A domain-containing protein 1-like n=1 Tax=Branchiostoma belcheri TaxID=7741 RepID=A0A6P4ZSU6_BRABE|nr:PREDICTED: MAM and LDL-receptor class A domain-containing protein 1-like [Branchiostoma belcheri]